MITAQDVREKTFEKSKFGGGYDMAVLIADGDDDLRQLGVVDGLSGFVYDCWSHSDINLS